MAASFYGRSRLPFASPQNSPNPPLQLPGATQAAADLSCSSNKSLRPWQCPFKEVQGCRLPARKTRQTLPCSSQAPLRPRQTFPAAPTSPWGRGSVLLRRFKAAVCQPAKLPKPSPAAPRRHSGRGRPFLQLQQVPEAVAASFYGRSRLPFASPQNFQTLPCSSQAPLRPRQTFPAAPTSPWRPGSVLLRTFKAAVCQPAKLAKPSPAAPRRHSGRGRPFLQLQQVPEALAASFYGRSRLPFASPQNSPNPPLQLPGATQAAADLSCSSNKSLRPWQCPFKDVQGCRLPALKTPQALPCSSQAPLRPRQTFPAALTSPWGRGSVFLWTFKAAVCQPSKLPKPSPAAPRRHSGRGRPFLQLQQVPEAVAVSF